MIRIPVVARPAVLGIALSAALCAPGPARATPTIYFAEDFNDASAFKKAVYQGFQHSFSDQYADVSYNVINAAHGWTFGGTAELAQSNSNSDGALLLNEGPYPASASHQVTGLTVGATYYLTARVAGDNVPSGAWQLNYGIDGALDNTIIGHDVGPGAYAGQTLLLPFVASAATAVFGFSVTVLSAASPILDDIVVADSPLSGFTPSSPIASGCVPTAPVSLSYGIGSLDYSACGGSGTPATPAVPEPETWAMLIAGLGALGYQMHQRRNAVQALA